MSKTKAKSPSTRKQNPIAHLEKLEPRQLYSVVTVTPQNFQSVINSTNVGDTVNFTRGTYSLNGGANNWAATLPAGRHYIGNGATIAVPAGALSINFSGSSATTEITGFTFTGGNIGCSNGSFDVHDNTFTQTSQDAIFVSADTNSHFDHNTFTNIGGNGIYGYPGSNDTYDDNTFTHCWEAIHLAATTCNQTDVSGNVITKGCRIGIELQCVMTNLTVNNNYIGDWLPFSSSDPNNHMAISCATGFGSNITLSGNTLLHNADNGANYSGGGCAIEIFGSNVTVSNNVCWGWGGMLLNGIQANGTSFGNKNYGSGLQGDDNVGGQYTIAQFKSTDDLVNAPLSALSPLPSPPIAGTTSSASAPAPVSAPVPVSAPTPAPQPVIPAGITATENGQSGQVTVAAPAGSTLGIYASTLSPSTAVNLGIVSGTSSTITGIPSSWQVTVTVTTGGTTYTLPAVQVLNSTIPASAPGGFSPALLVAAPVSAPVSTPVSVPVTAPVSAPVTVPVSAPAAPVSAPVVAAANAVTPAPTNLTATSPSSDEVDLAWTDNTSGTGTYILQRRATHGSGGFQTIATLAAGTTSYTDTNVNAQWEYDYQLTTVVNGVASSAAPVHTQVLAAASVAVSAGNVAAPTTFVATSPSSSEVDLSWIDNTHGQASYVLQRRATHGKTGFQTIATIAAGVNSYDDLHVTANWEYDYRLVGVAAGVASPTVAAHVQVQTASGSANVAATAPAAPTLLLAASPNSTEVDLSWVDNSGGTATYVLARKVTYGSDGYQVLAALPAGTTSFKDTNVEVNWEYDYYVVAVVPGAASAAATVHVQVQPMLSLPLAAAA